MVAVEINFRPSTGWRVVGWVMGVFGLLFAAAGVSYLDEDAAGGVLVIAFGALLAITMLGYATALVAADDTGVTYRNVWARRIAAKEITSIEVRERAGFAYRRTGIVVARSGHKPLRLTALDRPSNPANQARSRGQGEAIATVLGVRPENA